MKRLVLISAILLQSVLAHAGMSFDKTVHDFGKISLKDGAVSCTFTLTNDGDTPCLIQTVVTTCSCIKAKWTRPVIKPGQTGTVEVTFTNEEGAHPFDKTVSVYTSDKSRPTVLHLRGIVKKN